ncbi:MAG: magnesium transporter [Magnetovibrio sp.]|nr:magnesium transporter [Magnetovibrio sp.]
MTEEPRNKIKGPHKFTLGLFSDTEEQIISALTINDETAIWALISNLHHADIADLLERLNDDQRNRILVIMGSDFDGDVLIELDEIVRDQVIDKVGLETIANAVNELESDDALEIIEELEKHEQDLILESISDENRAFLEEGLSFPQDSAGRLMQRELVTVPTFWSVGDAIDFMRKSADSDDNFLPKQFYVLFVVDPAYRPVGMVWLDKLLRTHRPIKLIDIMEQDMKVIPAYTDQEDVAFLFRQRDLLSAPVVDEGGRLIGAITIDDVVDVIDKEHKEDIMRMGGVLEDDFYSAVFDTARARFSWLLVNLLTAIIASIVIGFFETTIDQIVALAVLMPIVASMGGNAGTQTLTVAVRALAMKELTATNTARLIIKEISVGVSNGTVFAALTGGVVWLWFENLMLGIVISIAMIVNLVVASLAGTFIPIFLERQGVDPAVASSVFLTTITDVVGFFVFLGLAALILI